jgi:hypothetical protein
MTLKSLKQGQVNELTFASLEARISAREALIAVTLPRITSAPGKAPFCMHDCTYRALIA